MSVAELPRRRRVARASVPRAAGDKPESAAKPRAVPRTRPGPAASARAKPVKPTAPLPAEPEKAAESAQPAAAAVLAEGVRLSKIMAERGICSRREADAYIEHGWVFVNGERVSELGTRIHPEAEIHLAGEAKQRQSDRVTILLHKPIGYVSAQAEDGHTPAVSLVTPETQHDQVGGAFRSSHLRGLAPAGRLDIDSTGLLVLTQDGRIARQLIGDDSEVEKEYLVRVKGELIDGGLDLLNHGLELDGRKLRRAQVEWLREDTLRFRLREGRKRQIRRMCELVGLKVVALKRIRIGGVVLGDLPPGKWRFLRPEESF